MPHYYDPQTCEPRHFVPKKSGGGDRATTIRDARENGWVPGVTTVLDILAKPGLERWKINQAVHAVVTAPDIPGETLDAKLERVLETERQQDQESQRARDRGTEIHDTLEKVITGTPIEDIEQARKTLNLEPISEWVIPALEHVMALGGRPAFTEKVLVGDGYAGKADLIINHDDNYALIVDFKTAKTLPKIGKPWPEHALQLGAYAKAYAKEDLAVDVANLYISTVVPGQMLWCPYPDWQPAWECFSHILEAWKHLNQF